MFTALLGGFRASPGAICLLRPHSPAELCGLEAHRVPGQHSHLAYQNMFSQGNDEEHPGIDRVSSTNPKLRHAVLILAFERYLQEWSTCGVASETKPLKPEKQDCSHLGDK